MSSHDSFTGTLPKVRRMAQNVSDQLLPEKSRARYKVQFNVFIKWCEEKGAKTCQVNAYIKRQTEHYKPKKSEENIGTHIVQAANDNFLLMKVVLIIGVSCALRREELTNMVIKDIQQKDDIIAIIIPKTKTNISRCFVITKQEWSATVQLYIQKRLKIIKIPDRLFLRCENGKCCAVPVGINNIGSIPTIATFLNLSNFRQYTGHCFRRISATLLAKREGYGGWKRGTVTESYVADSLKRKIDVAHMITEADLQGQRDQHFKYVLVLSPFLRRIQALTLQTKARLK